MIYLEDVNFNGTIYKNYTLEEGETVILNGELEATPDALLHWRFTGLSKVKLITP